MLCGLDIDQAVEQLGAATRIAVVGNGGSGKSTFARRLGPLIGLPVTHLDQVFWQEGWVPTPTEQWELVHRQLVDAQAWILDGNFGGTQAERFAAADVVVFLDLPAWRCVASATWRSIRYFRRTRPDLAPGCPERLDRGFLSWVWHFDSTSRPKIVERIAEHPPRLGVVRLTGRREISRILDSLGA